MFTYTDQYFDDKTECKSKIDDFKQETMIYFEN